jgi:hypothetical protein
MAASKLNIFAGLRPRIPESLLPEGAATIAQNCDFAYGELRNTKGGFLISNMQNTAKSIYTDDGLTFYSWPTDVNAVRSPIAKDEFNRLYYTDGATMRVTNRLGTRINGGVPGTSYRVGVPRPTKAPTLSVTIPAINDTTKFTMVFRSHLEYSGIKYQEQTVTPTVVSATKYQFTPPVRAEEDPNTPKGAYPVLRITVTSVSDNTLVADIYTENSSFSSGAGIWNASLVKDTTGDKYTATIAEAVEEEDKETRAYVYTYVNLYGEESPPSDPTIVTTTALAEVTLMVTLDAVSDYVPIKEVRAYRTPSGSTIAEYFYTGMLPVLSNPAGVYQITDSTKAANINEQLSSLNYYAPPAGLVGLMSLPNGILCGWKGAELYFSEAYKPWAWPPKYIKPLPNAIVGGIAHGSGAVVTTVANPYSVSGVSPDSMTTSRLNVDQAGVSKWSIAVVDGAVSYASQDGLVIINGNAASLIQSQKFFTRDVWRERYGNALSGMRFSVWDGRLIVFHGSNSFIPFMIRFDEADGSMTDLPTFSATSAFVSQLSDQCYYVSGTSIFQFNGGDNETAVWESREMVMPKPTGFAILQSVCTGTWALTVTCVLDKAPDVSKRGTFTRGVWTVTISATSVTATANLVAGENTLRMVDGFESSRWKIKLVGTGRFRELRLAPSGRGLASL